MESFDKNIILARKGDRHAFALLYSEIYKDLYRYAFFVLKNTEDAEDAVSEAVIDAYRTIGRLRDENRFKVWFFKILSAKCKRIIKQKYHDNDLENKNKEKAALNSNGYFCFDDAVCDSFDLHKALQTLTYDERMIVMLAAQGEYSLKEIAGILQIKHSTVRSKYSRSLEKLRQHME